MKIDTELQRDVIDELAWEPRIDAAAIGVTVEDGVVTLTGHVPSYAEKWAAEYAAIRVEGVCGLANEILVQLPSTSVRTDADIARAALNALTWDVWVPEERVTVTVSDGWIKLNGTLDTQHQKRAVERVIRTLTGVKGVTNLIKITPRRQAADLKAQIAAAFQRSAVIDAQQLQIESNGSTIVLCGNVRAGHEREMAERAAWAAPGVAEVDNRITVQVPMMCKDKLAGYLRAKEIPFEIQQHPTAYTAQAVAASEQLPEQLLAKVVMVVSDGELIMVVLPADHRVDMSKLAAALKVATVRLAEEYEFAGFFPDCELGAMPPFGNLYDVPVYVDRTLTEDTMIFFQAGTHNQTMCIAYADYAQLVKPCVVDIVREPQLVAAH